jgi:ATP-dependent Clp protease ATP-binding subunit ClpX
MEQVMLDIMYDLPDKPKGSKIVIDEKIVDRGINPASFKMPESKSA